MHFEEFDGFTRKLCAETAKTILKLYDDPDLEIEIKGDDTPVTFADKESERIIREAIEVVYPDHGILGEEEGSTNPEAPYRWVVDPIDGTKSFAAGCPFFGTMIALLHEGKPLFGCMNFPALGKRISGDGQKAICNGKPARCSKGKSVEEAIVLTTDHLAISEHQNGEAFAALEKRARLVRTWGDCYGYLMLSEGHADVMLDPIMNPWDIMALIPIVNGAGGTITDWQGENPASGNSIIAANADLHSKIVDSLNRQSLSSLQ